MQSSRVGLVDERLAGIKQQALIVASTLAEYTTDEETQRVKIGEAEPLLRQLIAPTSLARAALRHRRQARDRHAQSARAQCGADGRTAAARFLEPR